ncbi:MAG: FeoB-associated Cys-rich membrane protein [Oscillospiraceae bacterium]|jgi:hypothetical protein|nr:FeoB-associated Cys-rich membrane protein [Oscillospiraceae bacterium]
MFEFLLLNLGTIIISLVLLGIVTAIIASMLSDKRKGKSVVCGNCACGSCPKSAACHGLGGAK